GFSIERTQPTVAAIGRLAAKNCCTGSEYMLIDAFAPREAATYTLTAIDRTGSRAVLGRVMVAPDASSFEFAISAFPNPSSQTISVIGSRPLSTLRLIDATGRTLQQIIPNGTESSLDVSGIPNGAYYIEAQSAGTIART